MNFIIKGLSAKPYNHLYGMSDAQLEQNNAKRYICDEAPGYPDRIEMRDADIGETLILVNHVSMDKQTPFKASHAIFVIEGAKNTYEAENEVPSVMYNRLLSLRGFDQHGMMCDAELAQGDDIKPAIERIFSEKQIAYIDAHYALRGCFSAKITRS